MDTAERPVALPPIVRWQYAITGLLGMLFGLTLYKSEVIRWDRINAMFRFEEGHMYIVIGMAIAVAMPSMLLIKRLEARTVRGDELVIKDPPFQRGVVYGGVTFGMGWAITAACPGPIYAQIAGGAIPAIATLTGALAGMYIYAWLRPRLPH